MPDPESAPRVASDAMQDRLDLIALERGDTGWPTGPDHILKWCDVTTLDGYRWRVRSGDEATAQRCRFVVEGHRSCGKPAVIKLDRGQSKPLWYGYCADPCHTYGLVFLDGHLYERRAIEVPS